METAQPSQHDLCPGPGHSGRGDSVTGDATPCRVTQMDWWALGSPARRRLQVRESALEVQAWLCLSGSKGKISPDWFACRRGCFSWGRAWARRAAQQPWVLWGMRSAGSLRCGVLSVFA